jgi:3-deoxy-7-phosphoheptulonate synthase
LQSINEDIINLEIAKQGRDKEMIVKMKVGASQKDIDYLISRAHSLGLDTHFSQDEGRILISLLGDMHGIYPTALSGLRGVESIVSLEQPFQFASRDYRPENTVVKVDGCAIGGDQIVVMAGPCAVENRKQLMDIACIVKEAGANLLRGGAFKPRTSPYSFQGLGEEGLQILAEARQETGLLIITEVISPEHVPMVSQYTDVLQIGARNMHNYQLLHMVGESKKPVLLKRGMMSTIQELLMSAEYILSHGNQNVILCERGIRTFEPYTRNTLDIAAVPLLKQLTHLPIIVDPSHATGRSDLVIPVSKAAIAAGSDGLLVEVHTDPDNALSDGYQSLSPAQFISLMGDLEQIALAVGRRITLPEHPQLN